MRVKLLCFLLMLFMGAFCSTLQSHANACRCQLSGCGIGCQCRCAHCAEQRAMHLGKKPRPSMKSLYSHGFHSPQTSCSLVHISRRVTFSSPSVCRIDGQCGTVQAMPWMLTRASESQRLSANCSCCSPTKNQLNFIKLWFSPTSSVSLPIFEYHTIVDQRDDDGDSLHGSIPISPG